MANEKPALLEALEAAHEKYLKTVGEKMPPDAAKHHQENSRKNFESLLKEAEAQGYKEEFMKESIEMILRGVEDIKDDEEALDDGIILKGFCSNPCFDALLRSYVQASVMALAKTSKEDDKGGLICEVLTKKVTETVVEMVKTANSTKSSLEAHKTVHELVKESTGFMKLIQDAVEANNFEVIDYRGLPKRDEYN